MKTRLLWFVLIFLNHSFLFSQNITPVVENVTFSQRTDGSFMVDVYYDVTDADSNGMTVSMKVSGDGGITWNFPCANTNGDIGEYILSGSGKHIIWDFGLEHPVAFGDHFRIKLTANDEPLTDINGNTYHIVKIGDQWWMAENLKVTRYSDGDSIPNVTDNSEWTGLSTGAYCAYNNDTSYVDTYGLLYNWYAVDDSRNIAPEGWHVPTDEEWKQLEMHLGMSQSEADDTGYRGTDEGGKLKEVGNEHWNSPNTGATNESGFSALPGGSRHYYHGTFTNIGYSGYWWSSTEYSSARAWYRSLTFHRSDVYRYYGNKRPGFSVRCVRD